MPSYKESSAGDGGGNRNKRSRVKYGLLVQFLLHNLISAQTPEKKLQKQNVKLQLILRGQIIKG